MPDPRPVCDCGYNAQVRRRRDQVGTHIYIKCCMCGRKTDEHETVEQARQQWVLQRNVRRWYK